MMSKRTKVLAAAMATMMMASVFVGCGDKDEKGGTSSGDKDTKYAKELTVWDHLTPEEHNALDPIIQKWGEDNGVTITFKNDQAKMQDYMDAAKSSAGPTLYFGMAADNLGTGQSQGYLEKVPEGIIDEKATAEAALAAGKWDGDYYAVPIAQECVALFYNADKSPEVPETMEDLVKKAKDDKLGFEFDITNFYFSYGILAAQGGYVFKDTGSGLDVKDIGLGNDGAVKGLTFLKSLVDDGLMAADVSGDKAKEDFQNGNTAFYISGAWDVATMKEAGVNFKVAAIPTINGGRPSPFLGVQMAFVNTQKSDEEKATAWALLKHLTTNEEVANILLEKGNRLPVAKSVIESDEIKSNEIMNGFLEQAAFAKPTPNVKEVQNMWEPGANGIKAVLQGKSTPEEAGAKIVKDMQDLAE